MQHVSYLTLKDFYLERIKINQAIYIYMFLFFFLNEESKHEQEFIIFLITN